MCVYTTVTELFSMGETSPERVQEAYARINSICKKAGAKVNSLHKTLNAALHELSAVRDKTEAELAKRKLQYKRYTKRAKGLKQACEDPEEGDNVEDLEKMATDAADKALNVRAQMQKAIASCKAEQKRLEKTIESTRVKIADAESIYQQNTDLQARLVASYPDVLGDVSGVPVAQNEEEEEQEQEPQEEAAPDAQEQDYGEFASYFDEADD